MAQERLAPDALVAQVNLSGAVADIDDDPDAADANWLTAPGSNSNTEARVTFPTPADNPTTGAGLQEFRVRVRKTNHSTDPSCTLELWENGALVAQVLAATAVSSTTGVVLSATWNAAQLAGADGALAECRVVGTVGGGNPGNRASLELGAVEWNAEVTAAAVALAGGANALSSAGGGLAVLRGALGFADSLTMPGGRIAVARRAAGLLPAAATFAAGLTVKSGFSGSAAAASGQTGALGRGLGLASGADSLSVASARVGVARPLGSTPAALALADGTLTLRGSAALNGNAASASGTASTLGVSLGVAGTASATALGSAALSLDSTTAFGGGSPVTSATLAGLALGRGLTAPAAGASLAAAGLSALRGLAASLDGLVGTGGSLSAGGPGGILARVALTGRRVTVALAGRRLDYSLKGKLRGP